MLMDCLRLLAVLNHGVMRLVNATFTNNVRSQAML